MEGLQHFVEQRFHVAPAQMTRRAEQKAYLEEGWKRYKEVSGASHSTDRRAGTERGALGRRRRRQAVSAMKAYAIPPYPLSHPSLPPPVMTCRSS